MRIVCDSKIKNRMSGVQFTLETTMVWVGEPHDFFFDGLAGNYLHSHGEVIRRIKD